MKRGRKKGKKAVAKVAGKYCLNANHTAETCNCGKDAVNDAVDLREVSAIPPVAETKKPVPGVKWVYITLPTGKIYKLAVEKLADHYINHFVDKELAPPVKADAIIEYIKTAVLWSDIKDFVIEIVRNYPADPEEMFKFAQFTAEADIAGVVEE